MADTITLLLLLLPSIPISGIECLKEETVKIAMLVTARLFVNRWLGKRVAGPYKFTRPGGGRTSDNILSWRHEIFLEISGGPAWASDPTTVFAHSP